VAERYHHPAKTATRVRGEVGMGFRTVCAMAALLIGLETSGGKASAQYYYPPAQAAYPPPQAYPPQVYYPRQGYRPPVVDDDPRARLAPGNHLHR
jgi:hypothetical protein